MTSRRKVAAAAVRTVALLVSLALFLQGCFPYTSGYKPDPTARKTYLKVDPTAPSEKSVVLSIESLPAAKEQTLSSMEVNGVRKVTGPALEVTQNVEQRYKNMWAPGAIPLGLLGVAITPFILVMSPLIGQTKQDFKGRDPRGCDTGGTIMSAFFFAVGHIPTCEKVGEPRVTEEVVQAGRNVTEELPLAELPLRVRLLAEGSPLPEGKGVRMVLTRKDGRATVPLSPLVADVPDTARSLEVELSFDGEPSATVKASLPGGVMEALTGPVREERRGDEASRAGSGLVALEHYSLAFGLTREAGAGRNALFGKVASTYRGLPIKPAVPEGVRRLLVQAEALAKEGDPARSKQKLEEALGKAPWLPSAWNNLAVTLAMEKDYRGAIRCMENCLLLAPEGPEARKAKDLVYQWETLLPAGQAEGRIVGVGITLQEGDGRMTIASVLPGGPSERAGIRGGDVIEAVGGRPVKGFSVADVATLCRGEEGSTTTMELFRPSTAERLSFTLKREVLGTSPREDATRKERGMRR